MRWTKGTMTQASGSGPPKRVLGYGLPPLSQALTQKSLVG